MGQRMAPEGLERIDYRSENRLLLFGDGEAALARSRRTVELAGGTVAAAHPVAGAAGRLSTQAHVDTVLIDVDEDCEGLDALLAAVAEGVAARRFGVVVVAPEALIDRVAALARHRDVHHLCRPSEFERVAAVALAGIRRAPRLRDGKEDLHAALRQISEEVARIAGAIADLAAEEAPDSSSETSPDGKETPALDAGVIRAMISARRLRDRYLKGGLFADPAWDMMLDLMAARLEKHRVAVSSLCIAAAVPPTTALRWIKTLTDRGILVRCADPADGRRVYIELSDDAARALTAYIRAAQRISPLAF